MTKATIAYRLTIAGHSVAFSVEVPAETISGLEHACPFCGSTQDSELFAAVKPYIEAQLQTATITIAEVRSPLTSDA